MTPDSRLTTSGRGNGALTRACRARWSVQWLATMLLSTLTLFGLTPTLVRAQSATAPTPDSLAGLFLSRFVADSPAQFDSVDPDNDSRKVMHDAVARKQEREANLRRVVWQGPQRAVLLLTGTVKSRTGGAEANLVRHFSSFYEAVQSNGSWSIARQIPIDTLTYIHGQTIHAALDPAKGIQVTDTLTISTGTPYGFAVRLNNDVKLTDVRLDGRPVEHEFGGGVLWVNAPAKDVDSRVRGNDNPTTRHPRASGDPTDAQLVLRYTLDNERQPVRDTAIKAPGHSTPAYGAFHNTDLWHPFFGYNSANAMGAFSITVTLPADYHLTTTLPQTESVSNGVRTVYGRSEYPAWLLSLIWDRDWRPVATTVNGIRFETFTAPDFHFSHDTLAKALGAITKILGSRFGALQPPYLAVVEDRLLGRGGFSVHMGNAVVGGTGVNKLEELGFGGPSAVYAHEVSHGWTMNSSGVAANMLREGWATFAESVVLGAEHGPDVEHAFTERIRNGYMLGSEGKLSILGSPDNGSVHYSKGFWIFRMLNNVLGDDAFNRGMREYVQYQTDAKPAGYEQLIAAMSHVAGHDMTSFLLPWFAEKYIPDIRTQVAGQQVVLTQQQPTASFDLPLELELVTANGPVRRSIHLTQRTDTLNVSDVGAAVSAVHVDPGHKLLLQRHWGETVHFELPVAKAKGAKDVALVGMFALDPIPATLKGDKWVVDIPLSDGRYVYTWQLDGKPRAISKGGEPSQGDPALTAVRTVKPLEYLPDAYPR